MLKNQIELGITIEGIAADDIRNGLNELFIAGEIEVGDTLNDKWIRTFEGFAFGRD